MMRRREFFGGTGRRLFLLGLLLSGRLIFLSPPAAAQVPPPDGQDGQAILERIVALELTDVTLSDALNQIRRSTGIGLIYSPDLLPGNRRVSCPCQESTW